MADLALDAQRGRRRVVEDPRLAAAGMTAPRLGFGVKGFSAKPYASGFLIMYKVQGNDGLSRRLGPGFHQPGIEG